MTIIKSYTETVGNTTCTYGLFYEIAKASIAFKATRGTTKRPTFAFFPLPPFCSSCRGFSHPLRLVNQRSLAQVPEVILASVKGEVTTKSHSANLGDGGLGDLGSS